MSALSIRLTPEIEKRLELEVSRLKVTKSRFVQDLLVEALKPKDAVALLDELRDAYGLNTLAKTAPATNQASRVKELTRKAILQKYSRGGEVGLPYMVAEPTPVLYNDKSK
jgi:predicted DNA-binding protein